MARFSRTRFDTAAPDVARGIRAAVVTLVPFYFAATLRRPELAWTALGGWLGTLADPGGPRARRVSALLLFAAGGAALVVPSEALSRSAFASTSALALTAFGMSMLRALGGTAGGLGTFLTVVAAVASSGSRTTPGRDALFFALGAALALVVSSIVWPVWTHLPVRRAIAAVYDELAAYAEAARRAANENTPPEDERWTLLVREHHGRIRSAIESARETALALRARRQGETQFGGTVRALLGAAEAQFPLESALVVEVESREPSARADVADRLGPPTLAWREIRRILLTRNVHGTRRQPTEATPANPTSDAIADRLSRASRVALDLARGLGDGEARGASSTLQGARNGDKGPAGVARVETFRLTLQVLRDALVARSPFVQHALRTACAVAVASTAGHLVSPAHVHWVTLTTLAVLQPYPGATVKRASERVVGTVFGCLVALSAIATIRSPLALSLLLVPLSVAAVATRPRSYRLFTFFLTPVFVLLAERPTDHGWTAVLRAGDAILGGSVAFVVGVLVVPSSERRRLPDGLASVLASIRAYAAIVLRASEPETPSKDDDERTRLTRRACGIALAAAETALERYLAEPLHDLAFAADAMLVVTYGRRLATALTYVDTILGPGPRQPDRDRTLAWVLDYLSAALCVAHGYLFDPTLAPDSPLPERGPLDPNDALDRGLEGVTRWAALVASVTASRGPS